MAWCSDLPLALHLEDATSKNDAQRSFSLDGKHLLVVDTHQCPGTAVLLYALLTLPRARTHALCLAESPLHYQHLHQRYGGGGAKVQVDQGRVVWSDLSHGAAHEDVSHVYQCVEKEAQGGRNCVVIDSWFPLQCGGVSALEVTGLVRRIRKLCGAQGALVSLVHGDAASEKDVALFVYEADLVMHVWPVSSGDVTGRISLAWRGQAEPREALFTVQDNQVVFRPV